ncbi:hypothetical protein GGR57DRAFT_204413 [Xylariaceae sp. FL1272]|nr:hypothetical protein GGR57DRAFT_204413 [Xylariaceae sp. FL1272]
MILLYTFVSFLCVLAQACTTDEDCSLNGICSSNQTCLCDPGWRAGDCGELDLYPATRWSGYNHTNATGPDYYKEGAGNSSWCGHIVQDREDKQLFHLILSQMIHGCGLSGWRPFSTVVRAESRTGPAGPYDFAQSLFGTFHHNPTVIYSPADDKYLLYCIGKDVEAPTTCSSEKWANTISVSSSSDLREWSALQPLLENQTNPAPWPLWSAENQTQDMLLAVEDNNIYSAANYSGPYTQIVSTSYNKSFEDPFLWQDKRGNWHFLAHYLIDIPLGLKGPRVSAHSFARNWEGPWIFRNTTLAYNTTVDFTDGSSIVYYRRERPKLYFSDDGNVTPLYLVNGVQEFNSSASYTLIQPIGTGAREYERRLGF